MVGYLLGVSQSIVAALFYDAALGRYRGFNGILRKALDDTSVYFTHEKGIEFSVSSIQSILEGDAAAGELEGFKTGAGFVDNEKLALELARLGGVYFEDRAVTLSVAREILDYFTKKLEQYLLQDPKTSALVLLNYMRASNTLAVQQGEDMMRALARLEEQIEKWPRRAVEELVKLPLSEYISYDHRLQRLARERGVPADRLKAEIDEWIEQVKTPYEKGLAAVYKGKIGEGKELLAQAIRSSERDLGDKYTALGWAHLRSRDRDAAIEAMQKAVDLAPESAAAHHALATAYWFGGLWTEAEASARRALELEPRNAFILNSLGLIYSTQNRLDEATACYQSALMIEPRVITWVNLGNTYNQQGNRGAAIAAFESAIRLDPRSAMAFTNLGSLYDNSGNFPEALSCLERAIDLDPAEPAAHCNLGNAYGRRGDYEKAIACFKSAIALNPNYDTAHLNLARVYRHLGRTDEAIHEYQEVIRIDPEKSLAVNPQYADAHAELAGLYADQERYHDAVEHAAKALQINPQMVMAHNYMGVALQKQGKLEEAERHYREALHIDPDLAIGHYNLASVCALEGRYQEAMTHLRRTMELDESFKEHAKRDPDFNKMRDDSKFQQVIGQ